MLHEGPVRLSWILAVAAWAATAHASPGVTVYQSPTNPAITEGETVVDGDPASIYQVVLDYPRWVEVFPDIAKVIVKSQHGVEALVTLVHPDGNRDNLRFKNQPAARMVYFEDTGNKHAEVWGEIVFVPGDQPGTTRVHTRLYADVHGLATLVVSDRDVRRMRDTKIARDLEHVRMYFHRMSSR